MAKKTSIQMTDEVSVTLTGDSEDFRVLEELAPKYHLKTRSGIQAYNSGDGGGGHAVLTLIGLSIAAVARCISVLLRERKKRLTVFHPNVGEVSFENFSVKDIKEILGKYRSLAICELKSESKQSSKPAAAKPSSLVATRVIYCGDNLEQLPKLPAECVDLIYIDPPFNSNRNYEVFWGETKEKRSFADRHESTQAYIDFMKPRCEQLHRVLKKTGSFYFHCDWHASHHVRLMLDGIFGENNFQSEIIWKRTTAKSLAFKGFPNNHDSIFYYTAGKDFTWNRPFIEYDFDNLDEKTSAKYCHKDADGRRYTLGDLTNPNPNRPNLTYEFLGHKKVWRWTKERMKEAYEIGIVVQPSKGAVPRVKRYLDEQEGKPLDDVWIDIPPINSQAQERLRYPTQKPLALLDRIVRASSNENDIVLDAFCGCGTALVAAQLLKRQWIGIDMSPTACDVMATRLRKDCALSNDEDLWRVGKGFIIETLGFTEKTLREMPPSDFENWAVKKLNGHGNKVKVGDKGIDGKIYPMHALPGVRGTAVGELGFTDVWFPIQVKQQDTVHTPQIREFEAVMIREKRSLGYYVSFDFSSGALKEIERFQKEQGLTIKPLTVKELLDS